MQSLWHACLRRLEQELPAQQFNTWIRPLTAEPAAAGMATTSERSMLPFVSPLVSMSTDWSGLMSVDSGLKASLDLKAGGELGERLAALYDYMGERLLQANLHNRPELIDEVSRLLS